MLGGASTQVDVQSGVQSRREGSCANPLAELLLAVVDAHHSAELVENRRTQRVSALYRESRAIQDALDTPKVYREERKPESRRASPSAMNGGLRAKTDARAYNEAMERALESVEAARIAESGAKMRLAGSAFPTPQPSYIGPVSGLLHSIGTPTHLVSQTYMTALPTSYGNSSSSHLQTLIPAQMAANLATSAAPSTAAGPTLQNLVLLGDLHPSASPLSYHAPSPLAYQALLTARLHTTGPFNSATPNSSPSAVLAPHASFLAPAPAFTAAPFFFPSNASSTLPDAPTYPYSSHRPASSSSPTHTPLQANSHSSLPSPNTSPSSSLSGRNDSPQRRASPHRIKTRSATALEAQSTSIHSDSCPSHRALFPSSSPFSTPSSPSAHGSHRNSDSPLHGTNVDSDTRAAPSHLYPSSTPYSPHSDNDNDDDDMSSSSSVTRDVNCSSESPSGASSSTNLAIEHSNSPALLPGCGNYADYIHDLKGVCSQCSASGRLKSRKKPLVDSLLLLAFFSDGIKKTPNGFGYIIDDSNLARELMNIVSSHIRPPSRGTNNSYDNWKRAMGKSFRKSGSFFTPKDDETARYVKHVEEHILRIFERKKTSH